MAPHTGHIFVRVRTETVAAVARSATLVGAAGVTAGPAIGSVGLQIDWRA
jgi:hypothetical protein